MPTTEMLDGNHMTEFIQWHCDILVWGKTDVFFIDYLSFICVIRFPFCGCFLVSLFLCLFFLSIFICLKHILFPFDQVELKQHLIPVQSLWVKSGQSSHGTVNLKLHPYSVSEWGCTLSLIDFIDQRSMSNKLCVKSMSQE